MKQTPSFRRIALALLAATLCASAVPAFARTISATAGSAMIGTNTGDFHAPGGIVYNSASLVRQWVMPIVFDNIGQRTIRVRGRVSTTGAMSCQAIAIATNGTTASVSATVAFPANNQWTSISLTLSSVPAGATGSVGCSLTGPSSAALLGLDYLP